MTAREALLKKVNNVADKANKIDVFFVITFWNAPKELGANLDCLVAYFEDFTTMEDYYKEQIEKRTKIGLDFNVFSSDNSFYTEGFYKEVDREISDYNASELSR